MAAADLYAELLERQADNHQRQLAGALQSMEDKIAAYIQTAPDKAGKMFDLEWSVAARTEMRSIMEAEYLTSVQSVVSDYAGIAADQLKMLNTYGKFTGIAPEAISALQTLSFQGFEAIATQQLDVLSTGVYQAALTGRTKADLITELRGDINGIYQASDQEEIRQLVDVAQGSTGAAQQAAVERLHSVYSADRLGNNMRRYATQMATDSLNQYSASVTAKTALDLGIDRFEYYGDLINDSRQFCVDHVGKTYTTEEIKNIWEGSWAGKAAGDPFIVRGGYNCRHQWLPKVDDVNEVEQEQEPEAEQARAIPNRSKSAVKTALTKRFAEAAEDPRYPKTADGLPQTRFRAFGKKRNISAVEDQRNSFGKAALPASLTDEGASLMQDLIDYSDEISLKYGVPKLRGARSVGSSRALMGMGDGVLSFKPDYVNNSAAKIIGISADAGERLAKDKAKLEALQANLLVEEKLVYSVKPDRAKFGTKEYDEGFNKYKAAVTAYNKKVDAANRLEKKIRKLSAATTAEVSEISAWRVGDPLNERPFNIFNYLDDEKDKIRSTLAHEMAHQIHQQWNVKSRVAYNDPAMEQILKSLHRKLGKSRISPSIYADTDDHEWFAESFALHEFGRDDLIDPSLVEVIKMIKEKKTSMYIGKWIDDNV
jgi:hypothetical protein